MSTTRTYPPKKPLSLRNHPNLKEKSIFPENKQRHRRIDVANRRNRSTSLPPQVKSLLPIPSISPFRFHQRVSSDSQQDHVRPPRRNPRRSRSTLPRARPLTPPPKPRARLPLLAIRDSQRRALQSPQRREIIRIPPLRLRLRSREHLASLQPKLQPLAHSPSPPFANPPPRSLRSRHRRRKALRLGRRQRRR